jgi:small subunit ribosomal protein S21|tara:strand:+ start:360 stop:560 length:201 start_codon:yes stop_codon:yes gene_type:complete
LLKVNIRKGQSVEKALKIFKRKVKDSGIMFDLKERSYYKKPSQLKREQRNKAKLRAKYEKLKNQDD